MATVKGTGKYYNEYEGIYVPDLETDWLAISKLNLTESFIRAYKSKLNWSFVSRCSILSEEFIREFQSAVDWLQILASQELSDNFKLEFSDRFIDMDAPKIRNKEE